MLQKKDNHFRKQEEKQETSFKHHYKLRRMEDFFASFNIAMEEEFNRLEELLPFHEHPLIPFTRFDLSKCEGCYSSDEDHTTSYNSQQLPGRSYIYGGYRCNEPGCDVVFHEDCAKPLPEIKHPYHPHHPLKLILVDRNAHRCSFCGENFSVGYCCSICNFELDSVCAKRPAPLALAANSNLHEHPLQLSHEAHETLRDCKGCGHPHKSWKHFYKCHQCEFVISLGCIDENSSEAYHTFIIKLPKDEVDVLICFEM